MLQLHKKNQVDQVVTEPLNPRDVIRVLQLLIDNLESSMELLNVRPVFKRQQDNFDEILYCLNHLIFLLSETMSSGYFDQQLTRRLVLRLSGLDNLDRLVLTRQVVRRLVKIDPRSSSGESLLHLAARATCLLVFKFNESPYFPSRPVAQLLMELGGADLFALDNRHSTPLHTACKPINYHADDERTLNYELVEYFLSWRVNIHQGNLDGERPSNMLLKLPDCSIQPIEHIRCEIKITF